MLSIFEDKTLLTSEPEKRPTRDRLQEVLGGRPVAVAEEPATVEVTSDDLAPPKAASPVPFPWEPKTTTPRPHAPAAPAAAGPQRSDSASPELQQFADQFARTFLESLSWVMKDVQALLSEDRKRLAAALDELRMNSRDAEAVRGEMDSLRLKVGALENGRQQLTSRLDQVEQNLSRSSGALHAFEETRPQIEKRLDLQAGAIRSLHDAVQSRDERLGQLLSTFQAMQTAAAGAVAPKALSNEL